VDVAANLARTRERIARAAQRAGRRPEEILLVAAAKQQPLARVQEAIAAGLSDVGENYVQEATARRAQIVGPVRWHLIGHLQRNKAGQAAAIFDIIQTIDSVRLAQAVGRRAQALGKALEVLIEVNTSGEASKFGVAPAGLEALLEGVAGIAGIRVQGLMTIGKLQPDPEESRPEFRLLAGLASRAAERTGAEMKWLSMGMSHDFEVAIEEGANLVRIGTGIFGPRPE
jgi:hypothetical protein